MEDESPADLPPPQRPWKLLQWLLLLSPSLLMIVGMAVSAILGAALIKNPDEDVGVAILGTLSLVITGPIAFILCIFLTSKLVDERRSNAFLGLFGIVGINFAIASVACVWIINAL